LPQLPVDVRAGSVITATINGCEIDLSKPIGSGLFQVRVLLNLWRS
jgi:hypothetical protein